MLARTKIHARLPGKHGSCHRSNPILLRPNLWRFNLLYTIHEQLRRQLPGYLRIPRRLREAWKKIYRPILCTTDSCQANQFPMSLTKAAWYVGRVIQPHCMGSFACASVQAPRYYIRASHFGPESTPAHILVPVALPESCHPRHIIM